MVLLLPKSLNVHGEMSYFCPAEDIWMLMMMSVIVQFDQDFLENMEDFVTLDELAEDEDEAGGQSDTIGT